jgi:uncharacterized protein YjiS (DUF1127 family)
MPCAGPHHSCNSLLSVRSPLGEIRLGPPGSAKPAARPLWPLIRTYRASRELLAHRRQRRALGQLDQRLLTDIGLSQADADEETRRPSRREILAFFVFPGFPFRLLRVLRAAAERFARQRLRCAARELDQSLLERIAASDPEVAREIRKLFGL